MCDSFPVSSIFSVRDVGSIRLNAERKLKLPASSPTHPVYCRPVKSQRCVTVDQSQRYQPANTEGLETLLLWSPLLQSHNPLLLPASQERASDRAIGGGVGRWRDVKCQREEREDHPPISSRPPPSWRRTSRGARGGKESHLYSNPELIRQVSHERSFLRADRPIRAVLAGLFVTVTLLQKVL